jgi:hypothetical protein
MGDVRKLTFDDLPDEPRERKRGDWRALSFDDLPSEALSAMQAGGALATGFNRAALAQLPGLPVKTALDVADLMRAGYGYLGHKAGFLEPEQMPEPLDRRRYAGSPEWIAAKIESNPYGAAAINNPRPDDPTARVLNAGGNAVGSAVTGNARDAAMQFGSGVAGQVASELGASPEWAMVAGMAPQTGTVAAAEAARRSMRGGAQGQREMQERMAMFEQAGVDPTVGLATGRRGPQAIESAFAKTPGGAGVMARKVEAMQDQMRDTANAARDRVSDTYGPGAAGDAARQGIQAYRGRQQDIYGAMQDRALRMVPEGMTFPANATLARGAATLADIEGAPNVSRVVNKPLGFTQDVLGALEKDAQPRPPQQVPSRILQENGQPFAQEIPGAPGGIPFEGLKALKSRVGQLAYADNPLMADANSGAMKALYGGAKEDLRSAALMADAERAAQGQQPGVLRQLDRADRFYTQSQRILENVLAPIHKATEAGSERGYYRIEGDLRNSGKQAQRLMASLPLDARKQVTATVIDRLGKASPGQQNAEGSAFSPQTFLTNWNKLAPESKSALFSSVPNGSHVATKLESLAKTTEAMNKAAKVYANPSGTAQATNVVGAATGLASGLALMASGRVGAGMVTMGTVLGSMAAANGGARLMTSPKFVTWLSQTTEVKPDRMQQHLRRLAINATQEKNPEQRAALEAFVDDFAAELR